eukprot:Opistho-1_new@21451
MRLLRTLTSANNFVRDHCSGLSDESWCWCLSLCASTSATEASRIFSGALYVKLSDDTPRPPDRVTTTTGPVPLPGFVVHLSKLGLTYCIVESTSTPQIVRLTTSSALSPRWSPRMETAVEPAAGPLLGDTPLISGARTRDSEAVECESASTEFFDAERCFELVMLSVSPSPRWSPSAVTETSSRSFSFSFFSSFALNLNVAEHVPVPPDAVVTMTVPLPRTLAGGVTHVILFGETYSTDERASTPHTVSPTMSARSLPRFDPLIVMVVPPSSGPFFGLMLVTSGGFGTASALDSFGFGGATGDGAAFSTMGCACID